MSATSAHPPSAIAGAQQQRFGIRGAGAMGTILERGAALRVAYSLDGTGKTLRKPRLRPLAPRRLARSAGHSDRRYGVHR
jgi:hypothetical protein